MVQINRIKRHSPQEGKNKWLILVFCSNCFFSSQVRVGWGGDGVLFFQRSFLSLLYRIQRQGNVLIQRQEDVLIGYDWLSDALEHVKSIFSEVCD